MSFVQCHFESQRGVTTRYNRHRVSIPTRRHTHDKPTQLKKNHVIKKKKQTAKSKQTLKHFSSVIRNAANQNRITSLPNKSAFKINPIKKTALKRKPIQRQNNRHFKKHLTHKTHKIFRQAPISNFLKECIAGHNAVRRSHNLPQLVLDDALTQSAQLSADYIASRPSFPLDHNYPELKAAKLGENLTRGYNSCSAAIVNHILIIN